MSASRGSPVNVARVVLPRAVTGWIAVALGFGVVAVGLLSFVISNAVTNGGNEAAPLWLRILVPASVLAVAIPAAILGFRSRRTDPSVLGIIALVIACVIGGWSAFTGVAGFYL